MQIVLTDLKGMHSRQHYMAQDFSEKSANVYEDKVSGRTCIVERDDGRGQKGWRERVKGVMRVEDEEIRVVVHARVTTRFGRFRRRRRVVPLTLTVPVSSLLCVYTGKSSLPPRGR